MDLSWMAWTGPTAAFFACIAAMLVAMTLWEVASPSPDRRGFLPISTTRGDRLFIGLLTGAWGHLAWLGLTDAPLWGALGLTLLWIAILLKWG